MAKATQARQDTQLIVSVLTELELATQELIAQNIADYDERVNLADFACRVTELLVEILHAKAGIKDDKTTQLIRQARI